MDKNTISTYGWMIIAVIIISTLIVAVAPFAQNAMNSFGNSPDKYGYSNLEELGEEKNTQMLPTPTNLTLSEAGIFSFDSVQNANKYIITVKTNTTVMSTIIENTSIDLSAELKNSNNSATIEVVAISDHSLYRNSDRAMYTVKH